MTPSKHRARHVELHRALDELFADYIRHHPDQREFLKMPIDELMKWSYVQTLGATELPAAGSPKRQKKIRK